MKTELSKPFHKTTGTNQTSRRRTKRIKIIKYSEKIKENAVRRYINGESTTELSEVYGCSTSSISRWVKNSNSKTRKRHVSCKKKINSDAFSEVNPQSLYWAGFLMADGSIVENEVKLEISCKDKNHIKKFKNFLKSNHKITERSNRNTVQIQFTDEKIVNDLSYYGIIQQKSYGTEAKNECKDSRHFWRGMVDGDGSVVIDRGYLKISLTGVKNLIEQFSRYFYSITSRELTVSKNDKKSNSFRITTAGSYAETILKNLYIPSGIFLERKKKTVVDYIQ